MSATVSSHGFEVAGCSSAKVPERIAGASGADRATSLSTWTCSMQILGYAGTQPGLSVDPRAERDYRPAPRPGCRESRVILDRISL